MSLRDDIPEALEAKPERRRFDPAVLVIAAVLLALAGAVAWDAASLGGGGSYASVGPKDFPYMLAGALAALAVWTAFEAVAGDFPVREADRIAPMAWVVAGLVAQIVLLDLLGFSIATAAMFALVARGFGDRRPWVTFPAAIVVCLLLYLVFHLGLELSLPAGPLEQAAQRFVAGSISSQPAG